MSENTLHQWLAQRLANGGERVLVGAGLDDCAQLNVEGLSTIAISTDTIVEVTHFTPDTAPRAIGEKAVAAALSDLAASGCYPLWGLVNLGLRRGRGDEYAQALMTGIIAAAERYHLTIVGGDTTTADGQTSVSVTVIGAPFGLAPISRSGARAGQTIIVTGELGGSLLGRHLCPEPRFAEIAKIIELAPPSAAMDISDGLAVDLSRLLAVSNVGAEIVETAVPISAAARQRAKVSGKTPLDHALSDGEDFELLCVIDPEKWQPLAAEWQRQGMKTRLTPIGRVAAAPGMLLLARDGTRQELLPIGYEHQF